MLYPCSYLHLNRSRFEQSSPGIDYDLEVAAFVQNSNVAGVVVMYDLVRLNTWYANSVEQPFVLPRAQRYHVL